jgi:hypothetical protein
MVKQQSVSSHKARHTTYPLEKSYSNSKKSDSSICNSVVLQAAARPVAQALAAAAQLTRTAQQK